jgi:hypothetical protein
VIQAARGAPARELRAATLARVVLALLVLASVAALFYAQALKHEDPLVRPVRPGTDTFQPSATGGHELRQAHFRVRTSVDDVLDISVVTTASRRVAVIATGVVAHKYRETRPLHWNGRTTAGADALPGTYLLQIRFRHAGQTVILPDFRLELKGPPG